MSTRSNSRPWTPDPAKLEMWARESGRPVMITEWYAKGADSGFANTGGAGFLVKTQRDRGLFYENFTLGLLESKVCVGWQRGMPRPRWIAAERGGRRHAKSQRAGRAPPLRAM